MAEAPFNTKTNSVGEQQEKNRHSKAGTEATPNAEEEFYALLRNNYIDKAYELFKSGRLSEEDTHTQKERILSKSLYLARPDIAFDIFDNSAMPEDQLHNRLKSYLGELLAIRDKDDIPLKDLLAIVESARIKYQLTDKEIETIFKSAAKDALGNFRYNKFLSLIELPFISKEFLEYLKNEVKTSLAAASFNPDIDPRLIAKIKEKFKK